jgi:L-asparaginase II
MGNPILVELTRARRRESVHCGALAIARANRELVGALGDVEQPIFARSAIKPLQALPLVETGAADRFGFGPRELAIACASHSGTPEHTQTVTTMLMRAGLDASALGCGAQEPLDVSASRALMRADLAPTPLNHNCSGKAIETYCLPDHPVQMRILRTLEEMTGRQLGGDVRGIDGCSVPNWAVPLADLARALARFITGEGLKHPRRAACRRLAEACWTEPRLVAGRGRLDSEVMGRLPGKVLIKAGAEGVYCGAFAAAGLGFALKIDDGGKRAAELVAGSLVGRFCAEAKELGLAKPLENLRGLTVGEIRAAEALNRLLDRFG